MFRKGEEQPATNPKVLHQEKEQFEPFKLCLGAKIEVLEEIDKLWYPAKVIGVDESKQRILVHFCGFNSRYDKWYDAKGYSVRPLIDNGETSEPTSKLAQQSKVNISLVQSLLNSPNKPTNMIFSEEDFNGTSIEENGHKPEVGKYEVMTKSEMIKSSNLDHIQATDGCLTGLSFNFSGNPRTFYQRSQLKTFIERYEGTYHHTFRKCTRYLIAGQHPKRKVLRQAKVWGIPVLDEVCFFGFVKQSASQVSFGQKHSKSSESHNFSLEKLSSTIKLELTDSPDASDIQRESESAQKIPKRTARQLPKATARRKRRNLTTRSGSTNKASNEENDRGGNSHEVMEDLQVPLTPCEAPTNIFETSHDGTRVANTSSSSAHTVVSSSLESGVKRRSKKPAVMTDYVLPRKRRKASLNKESATNNQLEITGKKQKLTCLIITTNLTERKIISPETMSSGERPKLTHQKRKYVRKVASQRWSIVNDEKDGSVEVVSRNVVQDGKDMRVECVFQEEARSQCPEENVVETKDAAKNPRGDEETNGDTTQSRALSASSGFQSDESSDGNRNSRPNIPKSPDIKKQVSSDSGRMIDSMAVPITTENSEKISELDQQSICEAQSSSSIQNNLVSERSNSIELDSTGTAACSSNSHKGGSHRESLFASTPPLSCRHERSFSIAERNVQTNTSSERCPAYVQCPEHCGTILGTEQVESHLKLNCFNAETECDICGFKMLRKDLQDHITRNAAKHISLIVAEMRTAKNMNKTIIADNVNLRQKLNEMITKVTVLEEICKKQELFHEQFARRIQDLDEDNVLRTEDQTKGVATRVNETNS